jgi:hypothetical protein
MEINYTPEPKEKLPDGKLTARWVYSRGVYQVYAGRNYLVGASGLDEEEVWQNLNLSYDVPEGTEIDFK